TQQLPPRRAGRRDRPRQAPGRNHRLRRRILGAALAPTRADGSGGAERQDLQHPRQCSRLQSIYGIFVLLGGASAMTRPGRWVVIGVVLLVSRGLAAQVPSVPAQVPAAPAQEATGDYVVGPRDLLEIKVLELPELNVDRRVSDGGQIDLPLLGGVPVSGMTASEIRAKLEAALTAKYVNRANVSVVVKEFANKPVSVLGSVMHPGSLAISGRWTLMTAITAAGGLSDKAGHRILVLRRADNGLADTLEIKTDDLFQTATPLWNIPIQPADVINVIPRTNITVFCL